MVLADALAPLLLPSLFRCLFYPSLSPNWPHFALWQSSCSPHIPYMLYLVGHLGAFAVMRCHCDVRKRLVAMECGIACGYLITVTSCAGNLQKSAGRALKEGRRALAWGPSRQGAEHMATKTRSSRAGSTAMPRDAAHHVFVCVKLIRLHRNCILPALD